ncbi:ATP-binding protein [Ecytonucleospora hepatopenaei]|uniref:ATP-binding protein n=1 Tax=Ecytonucleospora hepatopenaei TaxID=646526 RepID=A0A1W0E8L3_9MICR|nr:ATP-binding protein [Ecytonucleospora hepatopenaei]
MEVKDIKNDINNNIVNNIINTDINNINGINTDINNNIKNSDINTDNVDVCRVCYCETEKNNKLISPCNCKGSVKFIHEKCLRFWRCHGKDFQQINTCEQCRTEYTVESDILLNKFTIHFLSALFLGVSYFFLIFALHIFYTSYAAVIEDLTSFNGFFTVEMYHCSCVLLFLTLFVLYTNGSMFALANYLFTYWRIVQYNFFIDRVIYVGFSCFFLRNIYGMYYRYVQGLTFYYLNKKYMGESF